MLSIDDNKIACIKSLRKCYFPSLTNLKLEDNPIHHLDFITDSHFKAVKTISLENSAN